MLNGRHQYALEWYNIQTPTIVCGLFHRAGMFDFYLIEVRYL